MSATKPPSGGLSGQSGSGPVVPAAGLVGGVETVDPYISSHLTRFVCLLCTRLSWRAVVTPCNHVFCSVCVSGWLKSKAAVCPACRLELKEKQLTAIEKSSPLASDILGDAKIYCPEHRRSGCDWRGEYRSAAMHLTQWCAFVGAKCAFGCDIVLIRRDKRRHEEKECYRRRVVCDYCDVAFPLDELKQHQTQCSIQTVPCPLVAYGCQWRGTRDAMHTVHTPRAAGSHVALLVTCIEAERRERTESSHKTMEVVSQLVDRMLTMEQRIKTLETTNGPPPAASASAPVAIPRNTSGGRSAAAGIAGSPKNSRPIPPPLASSVAPSTPTPTATAAPVVLSSSVPAPSFVPPPPPQPSGSPAVSVSVSAAALTSGAAASSEKSPTSALGQAISALFSSAKKDKPSAADANSPSRDPWAALTANTNAAPASAAAAAAADAGAALTPTAGGSGGGGGGGSHLLSFISAPAPFVSTLSSLASTSTGAVVSAATASTVAGSGPVGVSLSASLQFVGTFGSKGSGNAQFLTPNGICVSRQYPDGRVYVCDQKNHRIAIWDRSGHFVGAYAGGGTAQPLPDGAHTPLQFPSRLCLVETGTGTGAGAGTAAEQLWVSDHLNSRIVVLAVLPDAPYLQPLFSIGRKGKGDGEFDCVGGVCVDSRLNRVWAVDENNKRIQLFDSGDAQSHSQSQRFVCGWSPPASAPLLTPSSIAVQHISTGSDAADAGSTQRVYITDAQSHSVTAYDARDGRVIASFQSVLVPTPTAAATATAAAAASASDAAVATAGGGAKRMGFLDNLKELAKSDKERESESKAVAAAARPAAGSTRLNWPCDLVLAYPQQSAEPVLVVSDCLNHRLVVFTTSGRALCTTAAVPPATAAAAAATGSTPVQLNGPTGIAYDRPTGMVYCSDSQSHRIQVFRLVFGTGKQ